MSHYIRWKMYLSRSCNKSTLRWWFWLLLILMFFLNALWQKIWTLLTADHLKGYWINSKLSQENSHSAGLQLAQKSCSNSNEVSCFGSNAENWPDWEKTVNYLENNQNLLLCRVYWRLKLPEINNEFENFDHSNKIIIVYVSSLSVLKFVKTQL